MSEDCVRKVQKHPLRALTAVCLFGVLLSAISWAQESNSGAAATATQNEDLSEVVITAPEPRFVSPTRRDRIGRIWAPVYINGKGPFRLVLDTGATQSGVTAEVANALQIPLNVNNNVMLRGVTGSAVVPTIRVESLTIGDLLLSGKKLPVITTALGGAQGILGTEGLMNKRIFIDFRNDLVMIQRSNNERASPGFLTIPVKFARGNLLTVPARMGNTPVTAIIDTGGQATIANMATRDALYRVGSRRKPSMDVITGATDDEQTGEGYPMPPLTFGELEIRASHITFGDMHIFEHWKMTKEPAVLIGMDALGLLDTLIIDYRRAELQVKMRRGS